MPNRTTTNQPMQNQPPESVARWQELDKVEQKHANLVARGEAARFSSEWFDVLMAAGPHVQFRPAIHEPVDP